MAEDANAEQMVETLETALASNAAVVRVRVGDTDVTYDRAQALSELKYWKSQVARSSGGRRTFNNLDLRGAW
jgi:hypothetical protein